MRGAYHECEFVVLGIQHAMRMRDIVICVQLDYTMSFHIISQKVRFQKKKIIELKMCVWTFSKASRLKRFSL